MTRGKLLLTCFRKELRQQRAHLLLIITVIPLIFLLSSVFFKNLSLSDINFVEKTTLGCLLVAICVFGTDLLAGESRRGSIDFINRLPVGLRSLFFVKATSFFILLTACFAFGLIISLSTYMICHWYTGEDHANALIFYNNARYSIEVKVQLFTSFLISSSMILLAISCWFRKVGQGIALWLGFLFLSITFYDTIQNTMNNSPILCTLFLWLNPIVIISIAYFTFVHGYRFSEKRIKTQLFGVVSLCLFFICSLVIL